jgi:hypothetical protein
MSQSRLDSLMEALTNTVIGLVISTIANHIILPITLGVSPTLAQNLVIGLAFTIISVLRSYTLRRVFNGRTVWSVLKIKTNALIAGARVFVSITPADMAMGTALARLRSSARPVKGRG